MEPLIPALSRNRKRRAIREAEVILALPHANGRAVQDATRWG